MALSFALPFHEDAFFHCQLEVSQAGEGDSGGAAGRFFNDE
jgi:hypothetical protein